MEFDFWKLIAGLGLFMYGMYLMEGVLRNLEGRKLKLFLREHTGKKLTAIFGGTAVTALMQSSSAVNLVLLSFVGAGLISMQNALAIVLGSNIGGTFNSWLILLLGFKSGFAQAALPLIGISGLGLILFRKRKYFFEGCRFLLGLGFLFLGIEFLKESMSFLLTEFNFSPFLSSGRWLFLLAGFILTALVQTSAATVVITLSALNEHIFPLETAIAVILGAELGTTLKVVIGAYGHNAAKKSVATANVIFNLTSTLIGYLFLSYLVSLIRDVFHVTDPLFILVSFQTLINILTSILFFFFLEKLGKYLTKWFKEPDRNATVFLKGIDSQDENLDLEIVDKETGLFIYRTMKLNTTAFKIKIHQGNSEEFDKLLNQKHLEVNEYSYEDRYDQVKQAAGEILSFYSRYTTQEKYALDLLQMSNLIEAVRDAMHSAKGIKDIHHDRLELSNSGNDLKYNLHKLFNRHLTSFYQQLFPLFLENEKTTAEDKLELLSKIIKKDYEERMNVLYTYTRENKLRDIDISTLFNVNHEIFSSCRAILSAVNLYKNNMPKLTGEIPVKEDGILQS